MTDRSDYRDLAQAGRLIQYLLKPGTPNAAQTIDLMADAIEALQAERDKLKAQNKKIWTCKYNVCPVDELQDAVDAVPESGEYTLSQLFDLTDEWHDQYDHLRSKDD